MNIQEFIKILGIEEKLPIELAYGYTLERESLHINLYEDKVSRIVVDYAGNTLERIDQAEHIQLQELVQNQKRFYPNRVHPKFKAITDAFGPSLSITNADAKSQPVFTFSEVVKKLPIEEAPKKYYKYNTDEPTFARFINGKAYLGHPIFNYERLSDDVYVTADANWKISPIIEQSLVPIREEEYTQIKEKWKTENTYHGLTLEEIWTVENPKIEKPIVMSQDREEIEQRMREINENTYDYEGYCPLRKGYFIANTEIFSYNFETALKELKNYK